MDVNRVAKKTKYAASNAAIYENELFIKTHAAGKGTAKTGSKLHEMEGSC